MLVEVLFKSKMATVLHYDMQMISLKTTHVAMARRVKIHSNMLLVVDMDIFCFRNCFKYPNHAHFYYFWRGDLTPEMRPDALLHTVIN